MIDSSLSFPILGLVQGLTEFLPVSSSAHLALTDRLLRVDSPPLPLQIWLHLATLVAVLAALRGSVWGILRAWTRRDPSPGAVADRRLGLAVVVGTLPAAVEGILLRDRLGVMFDDVRLVGFDLIVTSIILFLSRYAPGGDRPVTLRRGLIIGMAQAVAILPGVSRSGSTLTAGLALGLPAAEAARFSFLLSIPAILGAALIDFGGLRQLGELKALPMALGFLAAAGSGYVAIRIVWRVMKSGRLGAFAPYCALLGLATLLFADRLPR